MIFTFGNLAQRGHVRHLVAAAGAITALLCDQPLTVTIDEPQVRWRRVIKPAAASLGFCGGPGCERSGDEIQKKIHRPGTATQPRFSGQNKINILLRF